MKKGEKGCIAKLEREREREYQTVPEGEERVKMHLWIYGQFVSMTQKQQVGRQIQPISHQLLQPNSSVTIQTNILYRQVKKFGMM